MQAPRCIREPWGPQDTLTPDKISKYLSYQTHTDNQTLCSDWFVAEAKREFNQVGGAGSLKGQPLVNAISCALRGVSEPLKNALDVELQDGSCIEHALKAFSQSTGKAGSGGVTQDEFPNFVRFLVAYRIHCYFETSLLPGKSKKPEAQQPLSKPKVVFILGGPGAGKGTQCARISETYGYKHLSAGDLLREERTRPGSQYGELIENHIRQGQIVPVEITIGLLENAMKAHGWSGGKFLVDGFPRNFNNLEGWDKQMGDKVEIQFCLFFTCSEACMERRLLERGKTSGRSDDNMEAIKKRFVTFEKDSMPVVERLAQQGLLRKIGAERSVEDVWTDVQQLFGPAVVFVLGGPGSGKGTICSRISETFGYHHLSAGDLLREERKRPGSELGGLIEECIKEGKLVPAEITVRLLIQAMRSHQWEGGRYLIDGFPRSHNNLTAWESETKGTIAVKFCLFLSCSEGIMEARLLERGKTSGRSDDNIESVRKRFITFTNESLPVVSDFRKKNLLRNINAEQTVDQVWDEVQTLFGPSVVFVLGGPGAGKGTQCARIVDEFGYKHLSAGDLLRAERQRPGSELGELIESYIKEGKIVPVEITVKLLLQAMEEQGWERGKYLVDGFPRNKDNYEGWKKVVGSKAKVKFALFFNCSEQTMEARCLDRGKTSGRVDDNIESIRKRFITFREESMPVCQLLDQQGLLKRMDCEQSADEVWADCRKLFLPSVIFMVGGPGAGKDTQCKRLPPSFGYHHISVGALLREESQKKDEVAETIRDHLAAARLVPSELVIHLLRAEMDRCGWEGGKFLIEGFPRGSDNWDCWQKSFGNGVDVQCMIHLDSSEGVSLQRWRGAHATDSVDNLKIRFEVHKSETMPVIASFMRKGLLRRVDGEQSPDDVAMCIQELLHNELDTHARNQAVIVIKPNARTPAADRFVKSYLADKNITIRKKLVIPKADLKTRNLFKRQYGRIIQFSESDPTALHLSESALAKFKESFGTDWSECLAEGTLVSAVGAMVRMRLDQQALFESWKRAKAIKLESELTVAQIIANNKTFFVVNGFVPYWQQAWAAAEDVLAFVVDFDSTKVSWQSFRSDLIGSTDPQKASPQSIRAQMWKSWRELGLAEEPNVLNNCIHASAGPLEALHERLMWSGADLKGDGLGRRLLALGIPQTMIDAWLADPEVEKWAGASGSLFDLTENNNTDDFCDAAWQFAEKTSTSGLDSWAMRAVARTHADWISDRKEPAAQTSRKPSRMTILHFNDVYNVEPRVKEPVGGLSRFVTRVKELKAESVARGEKEAVVLFSGDAFNPSLTSTTTMGRHMVQGLNYIGIHTSCYGNHDFDWGVDNLVSMAADTNFPWLISNVTDKKTGRPLAEGLASRMMDFHGRKIGLLGLVEREWLVTLATISPEDVDYEDFCPCAKRMAQDLKEKEGAEIVIALTHMRVPNDELLAHEVPEIDIILGGHDHHYDVKPVGPHGTFVLKSGTDFRDITVLQLEFPGDKGRPFKVVAHSHEEIVSTIKEDPEVKPYVDECCAKVGAAMDKVLGETAVPLDCRFAAIRTQETNIGNFVTDIMRRSLKADVAVLNSGTLRADAIIDQGEIKMRDLVNMVPMLDELCLLSITGDQLLQVLENSVSQYPRLEGRFAQVSGLSFTFDAAKPGGKRVVLDTVKIGEHPLVRDKSYTLCTKDYLRMGKDGYDVFRDTVCLADGEQAGILPSVIRETFQVIASLNGQFDLAPTFDAKRMEEVKAGLVRTGDGPEAMQRFAINPKVEGRIICMNPVNIC